MLDKETNSLVADNNQADHRQASPLLLRKYVVISLVAQILLSIAVLCASLLNDRVIKQAYKHAEIAIFQRYTFQTIGLTTRRFNTEIEKLRPNTYLVTRIQRKLQTQTEELREISAYLDSTINNTTGLWFLFNSNGVKNFQQAKPQLDRFIKILETISSTPYEYIHYTDPYFSEVSLIISPASAIAVAINSFNDELRIKAEKFATLLLYIRIAIVAMMIGIVTSLGIWLISPALSRLANVIEREYRLRMKMEYMANTDAMTNIKNREGLNKTIETLDTNKPYALAIIDLNLFKTINDTFGHATGDAVLIELSKRLKKVCHKDAHPARIGGDEFAIFDPSVTTKESCEELGTDLISIFDKPVIFMDRQYHIGGSVGIALSSNVNGTLDDVLKAADAAMYALKGNSKTGFDVFSKERHASVTDMNRKSELEYALQQHKIQPWYQPKVDMRSGKVKSLEALARWHHPSSGVLSPANFLADITQYGLHFELTMSIFKQILQQLRHWHEAGYDLIPVSINVSADVLVSRNSLQDIQSILKQYADVKTFIIIEITEDIFMPRIASAVKKSIGKLTADGVRFSIDDFGSGYASFNHFSELTFHELKIDKSFIDGIGKNKTTEVILRCISNIAVDLNIDLVAEGVETHEQVEFMLNTGCHIGQGYYYYKPIPSSEIQSILEK